MYEMKLVVLPHHQEATDLWVQKVAKYVLWCGDFYYWF